MRGGPCAEISYSALCRSARACQQAEAEDRATGRAARRRGARGKAKAEGLALLAVGAVDGEVVRARRREVPQVRRAHEARHARARPQERRAISPSPRRAKRTSSARSRQSASRLQDRPHPATHTRPPRGLITPPKDGLVHEAKLGSKCPNPNSSSDPGGPPSPFRDRSPLPTVARQAALVSLTLLRRRRTPRSFAKSRATTHSLNRELLIGFTTKLSQTR